MRTLERSALMPFAAADLFGLVADVGAYPEFLPGCVSAQIESDEPLADGCRRVRARVGFRVSALSDSFATENLMQHGTRIEMRLVQGPFRKLEGVWDFQVLDERACKVSLALTVDFASRIMEATLAPWMDRAVNGIIDAFRQRAEQRLTRG
ncbi:MAG: type toxin-antitoxin system RatA family toxin [Hydrocarboniphaga sp.]|uniref:type II toxin-antitoxin system RatA family toxin n=1 Tax=Hydrocarboniphaga sp. TaxID=2033016 RepID=UPI00261D8F3E|nr:type II toxin-antitoxin system RatA family toxin [Hydrocarboniphaga sp.]MDB5970689.1 type toxin-antitoxin system RatA family toxin [Hydrocarboniphaga sp.]